METFGKRLKRLRKSRNLTQIEVAVALEKPIERAYLARLENDKGRPSYEVLCALADFFDKSLDYLRFGDAIDLLKPNFKLLEDKTEISLVNAWRAMTPSQKRAFAAFADSFCREEQDLTAPLTTLRESRKVG